MSKSGTDKKFYTDADKTNVKKWTQISPVPFNEQRAQAWRTYNFRVKGKKDKFLGHLGRYSLVLIKGQKEFLPFTYREHPDTRERRWRASAADIPRALYGLPLLNKFPDKKILITEGEKAANAARLIPEIGDEFNVITWPGGNSGVGQDKAGNERVDWKPLIEKDVTIWPDNDPQGYNEVGKVVASLRRLGIEPKQVEVPSIEKLNMGIKADGTFKAWDLADPIPHWLDVRKLLAEAKPAPEPDDEPEGDSDQKLRGTEFSIGRALRSHPELHSGGLVKYDYFTNQQLCMKQIPGAPARDLPAPWRDVDTTYVIEWLQSKGVKNVQRGRVDAAIDAATDRNSFNSVQEYFDQLPEWDGVLRMERFFMDVCVAEMPEMSKAPKQPVEPTAPERPDQLEMEETAATKDHYNELREYDIAKAAYDERMASYDKDLADYEIEKQNFPRQKERMQRYLAAVARCMFLSIIARVYEPGCKVDTMVVIEGDQGTIKSTLLRVLALKEEWFTDNLQHDLRGKDAKLHISGKLIVEMAELKQFRGAEVSTLKSFISLQEDKFRLPYGHRDVTIYRQCVFIGTTNDRDYLTDTTGNRRYFPVYIVRIDLERAKESIEQIYAEAIYRRETGENANWWLSADEEKLAKVEQRERLSDDAWAGRIAEDRRYVRGLTHSKVIERRCLGLTLLAS